MIEVESSELDPVHSIEKSPQLTSGFNEESTKDTQTRLVPCVSLPSLSEADKALYEDLFPELVKAVKADEVVGELNDDIQGSLYYYRFEKGIIRGLSAKDFARKYPGLVAAYETKKKDGTLEPFDPTSPQVHPKWRIKFKLTISQRRDSISTCSVQGSQFSDESEVLESEDDDAYGEGEPTTRRSTRRKARTTTLPFSPRKTRSRAVYPVLDSEDDESNAPPVPRLSKRIKPTKIPLDEENSSQFDSSESDEYIARIRSKGRGLKKKGYKRSKPEYGRFRSVDEFDEDIDPDTRELREHWLRCGKCHEHPSHMLLANEMKKAKRGKRRKRISDGEEGEDEVERIKSKGGWVRCLKCPVSVHWSCLSRLDQEEILKAARERERTEWLKAHKGEELNVEKDGPRKRPGLNINEMTDFICNYCTKGGVCLGCLEMVSGQSAQLSEPSTSIEEQSKDAEGDIEMKADTTADVIQLLFRCFACKRLAHYQHIEDDITDDDDLAEIASRYQSNWFCRDCGSYHWNLDKILAWRPYPATAVEPAHPSNHSVNIKEPLPREYLVKWQERGYRRTQWVPHMWLVSTHFSKLKNFTTNGTKVELLGEVSDGKLSKEEPSGIFDILDDSSAKPPKPDIGSGPLLSALVDAEDRIPIAWKTVDRVLDVQLRFNPSRAQPKNKNKQKGTRGKPMIVESDDEESESEEAKEAFRAAFDEGEEPEGFVESVFGVDKSRE